jgi:hypothetical protein
MGRHCWSNYLKSRRRLLIAWDPTEVDPAVIGNVAAYANDLNTGQPPEPIAVSVAVCCCLEPRTETDFGALNVISHPAQCWLVGYGAGSVSARRIGVGAAKAVGTFARPVTRYSPKKRSNSR